MVDHPQSTALIVSLQWLIYISLASIVVVDVLIATSICVLLYRSRSGFKSYVLLLFFSSLGKKIEHHNRSNSLVNTLMLYSINTGELHLVAD